MVDVYELFGPKREVHNFIGRLEVNTEPNEELGVPTVSLEDDKVPVSIIFEEGELNGRKPVMAYSALGLKYHPHELGSWGTFVYLLPQSIYIIDGDVIRTTPEVLNLGKINYDINFGKKLKNRIQHIKPLWRFAVQALIVYDDGSQKFTGWDFLQVIE